MWGIKLHFFFLKIPKMMSILVREEFFKIYIKKMKRTFFCQCCGSNWGLFAWFHSTSWQVFLIRLDHKSVKNSLKIFLGWFYEFALNSDRNEFNLKSVHNLSSEFCCFCFKMKIRIWAKPTCNADCAPVYLSSENSAAPKFSDSRIFYSRFPKVCTKSVLL